MFEGGLCFPGPKPNPHQTTVIKSGYTYWRLKHIHQWSAWSGTAQGQLQETDEMKNNKINHGISTPSSLTGGSSGGEIEPFTAAGVTWCQQCLGLEQWNCSLTWKRLHGFSGWPVCIFGKLNGYIPPSALPPDCELHVKLTTDNQFQLRAAVCSAELWRPVADGGHRPLRG